MKQLSPIDSIFVFNEQPNAPLHISPLMFYDPSSAPGGFVRFKNILETFEARLHRSPVFRRKLVRVPLDLGSPYWLEDENFDLEFHVRHIGLPKPGDWRQFCILLGRLHSRPLDLTRPPWEAYVIEGLDNIDGLPKGAFALYMKIHHSAIDGATGNQMVEALHDASPDEIPTLPANDPWQGERTPGAAELLGRAYVGALQQPLRAIDLVRHTIATRTLPGSQTENTPSHAVKEKTRFNAKVTAHRVFGGVRFRLEQLKAVKNAVGDCTLNDAVLAVVSGAMRRYLLAKNELPATPLIAGVPISTRTSSASADGGNAVAGMRINLRTDVADPVERLRLINEDAVASKAYASAVGAQRMVNVAESIPSSVAALGMRVAAALNLGSRSPVVHTIVTNVPGPQMPMYMRGARAVSWYGAGCPVDGMGLFHTINSYCGQIVVAYIACREMLPDPAFYDECIRESFAELERAALSAPRTAAEPKPVAARPAKAEPVTAHPAKAEPVAARPAKSKSGAARTAKSRRVAAHPRNSSKRRVNSKQAARA